MKEIFCCGVGQRTPYCATCGNRLQAYPLSDLLNHCREQAEKAVAKLKPLVVGFGPYILHRYRDEPHALPMFRAVDIAPSSVRPGTRSLTSTQQKEVDKVVADAVKWTSWAHALERVMRHAATLPSDSDPPPAARPDDGGTRNLEM